MSGLHVALILAAVNAVVIAWATVLDNRRTSALARSLGATPAQVSLALATAQTLPALAGAVLGVFPGGHLLLAAINSATGGDGSRAEPPAVWQLLTLILGTVAVVAVVAIVIRGPHAKRDPGDRALLPPWNPRRSVGTRPGDPQCPSPARSPQGGTSLIVAHAPDSARPVHR